MSKAPGYALHLSWASMSKPLRERVLYQLGNVIFQLSGLRFHRIGSLFEGKDGPLVNESLSRGFVVHDRYLLDEVARGPFTSASEYYAALVSMLREHASCLRLSPRCLLAPCPLPEEYDTDKHFKEAYDRWHDFVRLGSKLDSSANRMDYVVVSDLLAEMRKEWVEATYPEEEKQHIFTLHHPDLSVNNIFVDECGNITCIIDWAFCSSVPLSLTLTAPGLPQSRHEISEELFTALKLGFLSSALGTDVTLKGEIQRCRILERSRPMWLLSRLLSFDTMNDYHVLQDLWTCVRGQPEEALLEEIDSRRCSDIYSELITELREDYDIPNGAAEANGFHNRSETDLTISKKLTMVSQWPIRYTLPNAPGLRKYGTPFIADKRAWRWISMYALAVGDHYQT